MQRSLSVLVLAALCTGCTAMPRTPDHTVLRSLRTIAVIPLAAGTPTYSFTDHAHFAEPIGFVAGAAVRGAVLYPVLAAVVAAQAAAIPEDALTLAREPQGDGGRLTGALARAAAETLQAHGARTAYLVDGYLRLPVAGTATSPADVEFEVHTRLRRWYDEDVARVDYSGLSTEGIDAILEVGVPAALGEFRSDEVDRLFGLGGQEGYHFHDGLLTLVVQVRLVNPTTKAVLGRATHQVRRRVFYGQAIPASVYKGLQLDNVVKETGREATLECLKDLGLISE